MAEGGASRPFRGALGRLGARSRGMRLVRQTERTDCGAACLAMVLDLHGKGVSLDEVRQVVGIGRDGSSAHHLLQAARWYGLRGRGVRVARIEDLDQLPAGAILHWRFHHFVVLERLEKDRRGELSAVILDPGRGRLTVGAAELGKAFTGIALVLEPGPDLVLEGRPRSGVGRYLAYLRRQAPALAKILTTSVVLQLLALALPLLTGLLVDQVVPRSDRRLLWILCLGLTFVVGFQFLASFLRAHLLLALRTRLDAQLTLDFLEHLVALPYAFFERRSTGDLILRMDSNSLIRESLTASTLSALLDGALVSLYLVLMLFLSPTLGLVALGLGLVRVVLLVATWRRNRRLTSDYLQQQAEARGYQVQLISGMETLKATGNEELGAERWAHHYVDELNASLAQGRLSALVESLLSTLVTGSPLVLLAVGGWLVIEGELSLGTMLALSALGAGFLAPLTTLVQTSFELQRMGSYLERLDDVLDTPVEQDRSTVQAPGPLTGRIELDGVSFSYGPLAPPAVRDVSLVVEPGQMVAVVGRSGSGKSTLGSLICGLRPPTAGRVRLDGQDLEGLDLRAVRRQLGVVPQHPYLFAMSLRENIALGVPDATSAQVVEAARRAAIHEEILAMPMGYQTTIADGGVGLSGGQRQRIALARALCHRPALLLLDEATSALDSVTEREVYRQLDGLDATRVVIAHRLSTIRAADQILVLEAGRLVDRGRHEELLERCDLYRQLVEADDEVESAAPLAGAGR